MQMCETTWWNVSADNCGLTKYGLTMYDFKESPKLYSTVSLNHLDSSAHEEKITLQHVTDTCDALYPSIATLQV